MAQTRVRTGTPTGGQYAAGAHDEAADVVVDESDDDGSQPCGQCRAPTKRSSGLCRRCDPAAKARQEAKARSGPSPAKGVAGPARGGPTLDRDAESLTEEEIGQCDYGFVPVYRGGDKVYDPAGSSATRPCRSAVVLPATRCHRHGGGQGSSLGRSVAKAKAEAARGQCLPLAAEHWDASEERLASARGDLLAMMETDTSAMAQAYVAFRAQRSETVERFSSSNQLLLLSQYMDDSRRRGLGGQAALSAAVQMASEPHFTSSQWAQRGRTVDDGAKGAVVLWWSPSGGHRSEDDSKDDNEDSSEDGEGTADAPRRRRPRFGAHVQHRLSETSGEDYEVVLDPLAAHRPSGHGDPRQALDTMASVADDMGIEVTWSPDPGPSGALGYWSASKSEIFVWTGAGGGDERAVAHTLAHELGHARLGHSTDASAESRSAEKEVAAESFAMLVSAHHGIDASEVGAHYVNHWRETAGIDMTAAGDGPMRSAIEAFDEYLTATQGSVEPPTEVPWTAADTP